MVRQCGRRRIKSNCPNPSEEKEKKTNPRLLFFISSSICLSKLLGFIYLFFVRHSERYASSSCERTNTFLLSSSANGVSFALKCVTCNIMCVQSWAVSQALMPHLFNICSVLVLFYFTSLFVACSLTQKVIWRER